MLEAQGSFHLIAARPAEIVVPDVVHMLAINGSLGDKKLSLNTP